MFAGKFGARRPQVASKRVIPPNRENLLRLSPPSGRPQDAANRFKNVVGEKTRGRKHDDERHEKSGKQEKRNGESVTHCHPVALSLPPMVTSPLPAEGLD